MNIRKLVERQEVIEKRLMVLNSRLQNLGDELGLDADPNKLSVAMAGDEGDKTGVLIELNRTINNISSIVSEISLKIDRLESMLVENIVDDPVTRAAMASPSGYVQSARG